MMLSTVKRLGLAVNRIAQRQVQLPVRAVLVRWSSSWAHKAECDSEYCDTDDMPHRAERMYDMSFMREFHYEPDLAPSAPLEEKLPQEKIQAFAVEAPDGISDDIQEMELRHVEDIIEFAAIHEDISFVQKLHREQEDAAKTFAVDAPDGTSDELMQRDVYSVENVIRQDAQNENLHL